MRRLFNPLLSVQRREFAIDFVTKYTPRKVLDLGCGDCKLLKRLKLHRDVVELLVGVDIDSAAIIDQVHGLDPLIADYLLPGERPLTIELYKGSVMEREPCTKGFDLVTCLELIEHLEPSKVETFSDVLFGYMVPKAVIISTPNAEFNSLLPLPNGFRHPNHTFEWTRTEFQTWAAEVCRKHGYSVEFTGVGQLPDQDTDVGFCSQIGVFRREAEVQISRPSTSPEPTAYQLLYRVVYPSLRDPKIFQRTLVSAVLTTAAELKRKWEKENAPSGSILFLDGVSDVEVHIEEEEDDETDEVLYRHGRWVFVPLQRVLSSSRVRNLCGDVHSLRETLSKDPQVRLDVNESAVMLSDDEEDEEEEEVVEEEDWDPSEITMVERFTILEIANKEDWENDLV